ncbi:glycosyltransferase [Arthrobacter sp. H-02-3]|uniref:glycosyltransferase n=1 Tax=Arthrobacter sp. H-02-3 TaxID=2703675 RepID=UPI000E3236A5|nr:glycosyltransferase [Arthrobacter sp. H-02-3]
MTPAPGGLPATAHRRIVRRARKAAKRVRAACALAYLRGRNLLARGPLTGSAGVVVSLTSHGDRIRTVAFGIESIARGTVRPERLILWLDSPEDIQGCPASLRRLERRGLEIRAASNDGPSTFGPHTKYYPYVSSVPRHTVPLVTADDDILYPPTWLALLVDAGERHPDTVSAHWVSIMGTAGDTVAGYATWARARDTAVRAANFAVGVSGVLYPPAMLEELRLRGEGFLQSCPRADDIWLKWVAQRAGIPVRQIGPVPRHFPIIPGSQGQALMRTNVGENHNDHCIRGLFSAGDVAALGASAASHQLN